MSEEKRLDNPPSNPKPLSYSESSDKALFTVKASLKLFMIENSATPAEAGANIISS